MLCATGLLQAAADQSLFRFLCYYPLVFPIPNFLFSAHLRTPPIFWGKFDRLDKVQLNFVFFGINSLYKAKFLYSTLNPSKKFIPLKPEKRAVRFLIRICPQYWVSSIRGHIIPTALFSHSCILFSRNFSAPLLFILTDKIKNPEPLISKKFGISVWCRWRGSNPHDVAINGF